MEHRFGLRVPLTCPVELECDGKWLVAGHFVNASLSGALLLADVPEGALSPLMPVTVKIRATVARKAVNFALDACVVRSQTGSIAVEWRDMACGPLMELLQEVQQGAELRSRDRAFGQPHTG